MRFSIFRNKDKNRISVRLPRMKFNAVAARPNLFPDAQFNIEGNARFRHFGEHSRISVEAAEFYGKSNIRNKILTLKKSENLALYTCGRLCRLK